MGARKIERSKLRVQYDRFVQAWRNERRYQEFLEGQGQPLPEGHTKLGRKPTFQMWMQAMENRQVQEALVAQQAAEPKQVEVSSTEWAE